MFIFYVGILSVIAVSCRLVSRRDGRRNCGWACWILAAGWVFAGCRFIILAVRFRCVAGGFRRWNASIISCSFSFTSSNDRSPVTIVSVDLLRLISCCNLTSVIQSRLLKFDISSVVV